jgi:hypothetical protein
MVAEVMAMRHGRRAQFGLSAAAFAPGAVYDDGKWRTVIYHLVGDMAPENAVKMGTNGRFALKNGYNP